MSHVSLEYAAIPPRRSWRTIAAIFLLALLVRLTGMGLRGELGGQAFGATEVSLQAWAVANGDGFYSPFDYHSPSTHLPPVYPAILAGFLRLQESLQLPGHFSIATLTSSVSTGYVPNRSAIFLALSLNVLAGALLPLVALAIAASAGFPRRVGLIAALALCFCPEALRAAGLLWDEALFALAAAGMMLLLVRWLMQTGPLAWKKTVLFGLLNGVLSLLNPAMAIALPVAWLAGLGGLGTRWRTLLARAVLLAAMTISGGLPWHIRNWFYIDPPQYVFVRGNLWLEVWTNLNPITWYDGRPWVMHPWHGNGMDRLARNGVPLTEAEYYGWCKERSLASPVLRSPALLAGHIAGNIDAFWLGHAEAARWRRSVPLFVIAQGVPAVVGLAGWWLARRRIDRAVRHALLAILVVFPLPYYFTGGAARYRHPVDILIYLGIAWAVYIAYERIALARANRLTRGSGSKSST